MIRIALVTGGVTGIGAAIFGGSSEVPVFVWDISSFDACSRNVNRAGLYTYGTGRSDAARHLAIGHRQGASSTPGGTGRKRARRRFSGVRQGCFYHRSHPLYQWREVYELRRAQRKS